MTKFRPRNVQVTTAAYLGIKKDVQAPSKMDIEEDRFSSNENSDKGRIPSNKNKEEDRTPPKFE